MGAVKELLNMYHMATPDHALPLMFEVVVVVEILLVRMAGVLEMSDFRASHAGPALGRFHLRPLPVPLRIRAELEM